MMSKWQEVMKFVATPGGRKEAVDMKEALKHGGVVNVRLRDGEVGRSGKEIVIVEIDPDEWSKARDILVA